MASFVTPTPCALRPAGPSPPVRGLADRRHLHPLRLRPLISPPLLANDLPPPSPRPPSSSVTLHRVCFGEATILARGMSYRHHLQPHINAPSPERRGDLPRTPIDSPRLGSKPCDSGHLAEIYASSMQRWLSSDLLWPYSHPDYRALVLARTSGVCRYPHPCPRLWCLVLSHGALPASSVYGSAETAKSLLLDFERCETDGKFELGADIPVLE